MNILNIFKFMEPVAGEIISNLAKDLFTQKTKEEVKQKYVQPILNQALTTATDMAVNHLQTMQTNNKMHISEYEVAQQEKYSHTF